MKKLILIISFIIPFLSHSQKTEIIKNDLVKGLNIILDTYSKICMEKIQELEKKKSNNSFLSFLSKKPTITDIQYAEYALEFTLNAKTRINSSEFSQELIKLIDSIFSEEEVESIIILRNKLINNPKSYLQFIKGLLINTILNDENQNTLLKRIINLDNRFSEIQKQELIQQIANWRQTTIRSNL